MSPRPRGRSAAQPKLIYIYSIFLLLMVFIRAHGGEGFDPYVKKKILAVRLGLYTIVDMKPKLISAVRL